jgi:pimeloyl-ACP methyl ester carboxylesterase
MLINWCLWFVIAMAVLMIGLVCAGALYQAIGNWNDARRFPQNGKLVPVRGIKLNINCSGTSGLGKPTVILEAGAGSPARVWAKVQPEIAKFTRVCSYDRAGLGWSELASTPRTREQEAEELKLLLTAAGEKGPYVMAGHSQGGLTIQAFFQKFPDDVAGVVLVDASHPDTDKKTVEVLSKPEGKKYITFNKLLRSDWYRFASIWSARLGVSRLLTPAKNELEQEINYLSWQTKTINTIFSEAKFYDESADKIRATGRLGDRPLIVLTGKIDEGAFESPADRAAVQKMWFDELQKGMAGLSSNGKQIIVPDAGHFIQFDKPDAVVSAVREVWEQAKMRASN